MKSISIVATGDSLITMAMSKKVEKWVNELDNNGNPTGLQRLITMRQSVHSEPKFIKMVDLIRSADIAFTNHEMNLHDYEPDCYPAAESGGTYTRADPSMIEELKWMGFGVVSTANNHSLDYMYGGLFRTKEHLRRAGVPHAGTGKDLAEARQPTYVETPRGRVAVIAASSSFAPHGRAGEARRDLHGRPGLNPLRFETWYGVKPETMEKIKDLNGELGKELGLPEVVQPEDAYYFMRNKFVVGEDFGTHTRANKADMDGNLESIRGAARQADWVFFSLHVHEGVLNDPDRPAEFIEEFARAAIDAGAHAVIGHGHHAMRGIEIRQGRPIFYSLGNFIFQNETVYKMPADFYERFKLDPYSKTPADAYDARASAPPQPGYPESKWFTEDQKYWISVVPYMAFEGERLRELMLYPVELGQDKPRSQRGRPMFVEGELADRILGIITDLSKPYGTEISNREGVGVVAL